MLYLLVSSLYNRRQVVRNGERYALLRSCLDPSLISTIVFPTLAMEREQRSLGSGSVSTKEFQDCLWEGLRRLVERAHARGKKQERVCGVIHWSSMPYERTSVCILLKNNQTFLLRGLRVRVSPPFCPLPLFLRGVADETEVGCALAGALSKGLCYVNRKLQEAPSVQVKSAPRLCYSVLLGSLYAQSLKVKYCNQGQLDKPGEALPVRCTCANCHDNALPPRDS